MITVLRRLDDKEVSKERRRKELLRIVKAM